MDVLIVQQFFRELIFMGLTIVCAYLLVGGFIFFEKRLKRAIMKSALH
jgi:hypothetical protein